MDPLPIPYISSAQPVRDDSSSPSEEARRDDQRAEKTKAVAFRMAMERTAAPGTPAAGGRQIPGRVGLVGASAQMLASPAKGQAQVTSGKGNMIGRPAAPGQDQALSPSLLKLRASTARGGASPAGSKTPPQTPAPGKNGTAPAAPGDQQQPPQPPPPTGLPQLAGLAATLGPLPITPQMQLLQTVNPAAETARLDARAAGHDGRQKESSGTSDESSTTDTGSDPSGQPMPTASFNPRPAPAPTTPAPKIMPPTPLLQQVVEYATVAPNQQGFMEFRLGLSRHALGGLKIRVCAYGNRRIGLNVRRGDGDSSIEDGHLNGLIDALRQRNVEVVDTVFE